MTYKKGDDSYYQLFENLKEELGRRADLSLIGKAIIGVVGGQCYRYATLADETVFNSTKFRYPESNFEYQLSSVLYQGGNRANLNAFFNQWGSSTTWLNSNTALDRRLEIVYDDNPATTITNFVNVSTDNTALEEIIADMPEEPSMEYAQELETYKI